jgi:hydrogenase small subunit
MRSFTNQTLNTEPKWHHNKPELTTGYDPRWRP